jgi:hypothetical protein
MDGSRSAFSLTGLGQNASQYNYGEISNFSLQIGTYDGGRFNGLTLGGVTFSLAFGNAYLSPLRGQWRIGNGSASGSFLDFNATTAQVKNSVSLLYGDVSVTTYGATTNLGYIITAATANTAITILAEPLSLSPSSTADVLELTLPTASVAAQKIVRLRRKPCIAKTIYKQSSSITLPVLRVDDFSSTRIQGNWSFEDAKGRYVVYSLISFAVTGTITYSFDVYVDTDSQYHGPKYALDLLGLQTYVEQRPTLFWSTGSPYEIQVLKRKIKSIGIGLQTTSLGGLLTSVSGTGAYEGYIDDVARVALTQDPLNLSLGFDFLTIITGTSVTISAATKSIVGGFYDLGSVTFSGASLDEAFVERKSNTLPLTLEVTMENSGKKLTLAQLNTTINRNIA